MKYGFYWDKINRRLTVSRGWAFLFLGETLILGLFILFNAISAL
jgi:hypothetical protein